MGWKFNPFTGALDQTGSGGGGASYIDGEVATYNDLPLDGTAALDSAWLVRSASGVWPVSRKQAGIYIRTATAGSSRDADYTYAGTMPDVFSDANFTLYDDADTTKNVKFQLSGISTGTTRTLTAPNASGTIALTTTAVESFSSNNTSTNDILVSNGDGTLGFASISTLAAGEIGPADIGAAAASHTHAASEVGLGNVTNNAQTQAAIVPNTAPSAGQLLVGNAGGTAYAPASVSGDATLSSTGVLTLANTTTARTNLGITQLPAKVEVFTSSGTWTKPAGAKMVHYVLVGGGGGGGGGRRSNSTTAAYGGGGGAGGGVSVGWLNADFLGATETVTIGAGGSGGSARTAADTNGADGVAGNTTSFTAYLEARGGAQGFGGTTTTGTRGAATAARGAFYGGTQDAMAGGGAGSPETTGGTGENRMSMPSGGGGGAGKSAAGAYGTGGASAAIGLSGTGSRTGISATANAAGTNGTGFFYYGLGGSGGSPNSTTGAANKGGDGGLYGAGGGGGAGSLNAAGGDNSGGAGANGVAIITTYF